MDRESPAPNLPDAELVEVGGYTVFHDACLPLRATGPGCGTPTIRPTSRRAHGLAVRKVLGGGFSGRRVDVGESYGSPAAPQGTKAYAWLTGERA